MPADVKPIIDFRRGNVVCERAVIADRPLGRLKGLLGRASLGRDEGLLLRPAPSIHTAFMRFRIDALFLDRDLEVIGIVEALRPWRIAGRRDARAVLELAAGEAARRGISVGDRLVVADDDAVAPSDEGARESDPDEGEAVGGVHALEFLPTDEGHHLLDETQPAGLRVLLIARDRRFRTVASALLARRGCTVAANASPQDVARLVERERADVVVVDAGALLTAAARTVATVMALSPPVGVVLVGDEAEGGLHNLPVLAKWGPFEDFYAAIEQADRGRSRRSTLVG